MPAVVRHSRVPRVSSECGADSVGLQFLWGTRHTIPAVKLGLRAGPNGEVDHSGPAVWIEMQFELSKYHYDTLLPVERPSPAFRGQGMYWGANAGEDTFQLSRLGPSMQVHEGPQVIVEQLEVLSTIRRARLGNVTTRAISLHFLIGLAKLA